MLDMQTIMIVDDERFIHLGLDKLINWKEYNIRKIGEAYDGDTALELIKKDTPDIILTDIRMPGIDGLDLISQVSKIYDYKPQWIIVSGYESFSYAKKAMNYGVKYYLLKPIDENELKSILKLFSEKYSKRNKRDLKAEHRLAVSAIIRRLLSDSSKKEYLEKAKEILGDFTPSRYGQIIFQNTTDRDIETTLRKILLKLGLKGASERIIHIKNKQFSFIITESEVPEMELKNFAYKLQKDCSKTFNQTLYISIGIHINSLEHLNKSYISSEMAINKVLFRNKEPVFIADDMYEWEKKRNFDLAKEIMFFPGLLKSIEQNNSEEIDKYILSIYTWIKKNDVSPSSIKLWVNCLIMDITRLTVELGGKQDDYIKDFRNIVLIDPFLFSEDLFKHITKFCQYSGDMIESIKKNNQDGIVSIVIQNIRDNFNCSLSLKLLGEQYSQNHVYLGQLFKKKLGISFKTYLAGIRIEEAKKLLTRTDLKVYEVAKSVGYNDCDYFSKQFIKITGQSPFSYKKSN